MNINEAAMATQLQKIVKIGKIIMDYYKQLNTADLTKSDFTAWIESLAEPMKSVFKNKGLDECRGVLNFQRFMLELQDKRLTGDEFNYYTNHKCS
jgi:hypothetical protein